MRIYWHVISSAPRGGYSKVYERTGNAVITYNGDRKDIIRALSKFRFVFEDEKTVIPQDELENFQNLPRHCSHLFMACDGVLIAVICVSDPLREETPDVLNKLRNQGFSSLVMMTGDSKKVAAVAAQQAGVDHYRCEVLPDQKAEFVNEERADGKVVVMVGDGINDAPALSDADAGIAISDGAAIAREVADITVSADDLYALCTLKQVSDLLMKRVEYNYRFIMGFNGGLIALGTLGLLTPVISALLHNLSTLFISLKSMTKLLNKNDSNRQNY